MKKNRILIVEDNNLNLKLFYDLLSVKNFDVLCSNDGSDIINIVLENKLDLILMDIQLKETSGIDLIKSLKSNELTKNVPIIAISAYAMKHDEIRIKQSGCDLYISKPVSIDRFYKAVSLFINI